MSERPFMQFYISDYLGDTQLLTTEQHGAYLLLLFALWRTNGTLPNDDRLLARLTGLGSRKWRAQKEVLLPFFVVSSDTISHKRTTKELQKSDSKSELRRRLGAMGGKAKALKDKKAPLAKATVLLEQNPSKSHSKQGSIYQRPETRKKESKKEDHLLNGGELPLDVGSNLAFEGKHLKLTTRALKEAQASYPRLNVMGTALEVDHKFPRRQNKKLEPLAYFHNVLSWKDGELQNVKAVKQAETEEYEEEGDRFEDNLQHCRDKKLWWRKHGSKHIEKLTYVSTLWGPLPWEKDTRCPSGVFSKAVVESMRKAWNDALEDLRGAPNVKSKGSPRRSGNHPTELQGRRSQDPMPTV